MMDRALRIVAGLTLTLVVWLGLPTGVEGQTTARVRAAEENFRKDPNGTPLATVLRGTQLTVVGEVGRWVQVDLGGWIWAASVAKTGRGGFDLTVSADGGENLRESPQGKVVAKLLEGCLLQQLETDGNWVRVQRRGWLWKPSLEMLGLPAAQANPKPATPAARPAATDPASAPETPPVVTARSPLVVYSTPDGDTVARFHPGAQAQVMGRAGDWLRVRVDGWVYGPAAGDSGLTIEDTGNLTPAQLRAEPGRYKGALVRWRLQFISLQRAEPARTDFAPGEPFILARGAAGDVGFVYLAVPDELLPAAERLKSLEFVTVVGRVRTGRSKLLGSPVIDVTEIETKGPQS